MNRINNLQLEYVMCMLIIRISEGLLLLIEGSGCLVLRILGELGATP